MIKMIITDLDNTLWEGILTENDHIILTDEKRDMITKLDRSGILLSIASRNDERLGLSREQIALAESNASAKGQPVSDANYRAIRNKPLLMLHLINCDDKNDRLDNMAPAFGVSFPYGEFDKTVEVVVNQVWFQQMKEDFGDQDDTGVDDE